MAILYGHVNNKYCPLWASSADGECRRIVLGPLNKVSELFQKDALDVKLRDRSKLRAEQDNKKERGLLHNGDYHTKKPISKINSLCLLAKVLNPLVVYLCKGCLNGIDVAFAGRFFIFVSNVKGRAVVDGGSDDRQVEGDIDTLVKMQGF